MDAMLDRFCKELASRGIAVSDEQLSQFDAYYRELVEWNEKMNLTAITERDQVYWKHFYDSASLAFFIPMGEVRTLADIGSGAGFPSIPLKILFPHLHICIVDSLNKRIQFLNHLVQSTGLSDVQCIHARAEDAGRDTRLRDGFDLVTARAVARLNVLSELCIPFVRPGGQFIAMKGSDPDEELEESKKGVAMLGGEIERVEQFELPSDHSRRHFVVIRKTAATPKRFPRKSGVPAKQPL